MRFAGEFEGITDLVDRVNSMEPASPGSKKGLCLLSNPPICFDDDGNMMARIGHSPQNVPTKGELDNLNRQGTPIPSNLREQIDIFRGQGGPIRKAGILDGMLPGIKPQVGLVEGILGGEVQPNEWLRGLTING